MERCVTLAKPVVRQGIGVHTGLLVAARLVPKSKPGLTLVRTDVPDGVFDLTPALSVLSPLATLLQNAHGTTLTTMEHLLSALHGLRVDALTIEIDGPEVPILDGSAQGWVEAIDEAGRNEVAAERRWLRVQAPVQVDEDRRVLRAEPDFRKGLRVECHVDFQHAQIGQQTWRGVVDEKVFRREIAPARTFVREEDIATAKAVGLAKGGSLNNAVVFGRNGQILNPEGLRFADEPVRHKVLDFVGDIYLAARPVAGKFYLTAPGHNANNALLRKVCAVE